MSDPITTPPVETPEVVEKKTAEIQARELAKKNKELTAKLEALEKLESDRQSQELESQGKFKERAELSDKKYADLVEATNQKDRAVVVQNELKKAGINPDMLDYVTPEFLKKIVFDDNNQPTNLDTVVAELVSSKPSLFAKPPSVPAGDVGVSATTSGGTGMTIEEATRIATNPNAKEYFAKQQEVDAVLL